MDRENVLQKILQERKFRELTAEKAELNIRNSAELIKSEIRGGRIHAFM